MKHAVTAVDVGTGDVLCSALDPGDPAKVTKATAAALAAGTGVTGVASAAAGAGTEVAYYSAGSADEGNEPLVPASVSGLGAGLPTAVVVDSAGRAARQSPLREDSFVVGQCDAAGTLTVAPQHRFANVMDFGAKGDGSTDDWAAINAAIRSVGPATARGTVYFPRGQYLIHRPLVLSGSPLVELRGEHQDTAGIRFHPGYHGPALAITPDVGHLPTGEALLTGPGGAAVLSHDSASTIDLRDSAALDIDGLAEFSVECTIRPEAMPAPDEYVVLISSSGGRLGGVQNNAFTLYASNQGDPAIYLSASVRIGGQDVIVRLPSAAPVGVSTYVALVYDGQGVRLFAGRPGQQAQVVETPATGTLTQAVEEGVYLGVHSNASWPDYRQAFHPLTGRMDSVRISNYAVHGRDTTTVTAPTAKLTATAKLTPAGVADGSERTLMLLNFDRDVDIFTVGTTWPAGAPAPTPVFLPYRFSDGIPAYAPSIVRQLGFVATNGTAIYSQLGMSAVLDRITVAEARDGIRFRNNGYLAEFERIRISARRLGLVLSGNTGLVNVKRLQTVSALYDFVATDGVGVFARDWYIGNSKSLVPILLTSGSSTGFFHGVGIAISTEGLSVGKTGKVGNWQAAVMTSSLPHLLLESCHLETYFSDRTNPPCVVIDSSRNVVGSGTDGSYTFVNCDFTPTSSPDTQPVFAFSGQNAPFAVRLIGSRRRTPGIPWALPKDAPLVSFTGGSVSTTESGLTQWEGGREWILAYDRPTGQPMAREREVQATGTVSAGTVNLAGVPLAEGSTGLRAEVMATDPAGRSARWTLEQGFTRAGDTATPWSASPHVVSALWSGGGAPPEDWTIPSVTAVGGNVVVQCTAGPGQTLAFTVRTTVLDALSATP